MLFLVILGLVFLIAGVSFYVGYTIANNLFKDDVVDGILAIMSDGEDTFLFLKTDHKPEEFAAKSTVVFKVETQNPQSPL